MPTNTPSRSIQGVSVGQLTPMKSGARELGVPYTSLRDAVLRGELPVVKMGRAWYLDRRDMARFVESKKERLG